jgi:2-methylcitrate dehydratase PrpD
MQRSVQSTTLDRGCAAQAIVAATHRITRAAVATLLSLDPRTIDHAIAAARTTR